MLHFTNTLLLPGHTGPGARRQRGVALVMALIVAALLAIIVMEFVYSTSIDLAQATRYRDDAQVKLAVNSAQVFAEILLRHDKTRGEDRAFDSLDDIWATAVIPTAVGEASIRVTIVDESSKLNLLNLVHPDEEWAARWKEAFVRLCQDVREGAESEDYEALADEIIEYMKEEKQFNLDDDEDIWTGSPILSIDELSGVGELTPAFLYGDQDEDDPELAQVPGMWDFLTIHSYGAVNINTAPVEIIRCLHEMITPALAADVVARREEMDENGERKLIFRGKAELEEVEGMEAPADPDDFESDSIYGSVEELITSRSAFFLAKIDVTMNEVTRHFRVYYKRVRTELFRISLAEVQPDRVPLVQQGVDMEEFDPYMR